MTVDIFIIIAIIVIIILGLYIIKMDDNITYVHLKTGHKYKVICEARQKNSTTGEWEDCVIYYALYKTGVFSREKNDFFDKFILIKDYRKQNKKTTNE